MLIHTINREMVRSLVGIDVEALPVYDLPLEEQPENPWLFCTAYVCVHFAGFIGRAHLSRTSFKSREEFECDPIFETLVDAAVLDLSERVARSLTQLALVMESQPD